MERYSRRVMAPMHQHAIQKSTGNNRQLLEQSKEALIRAQSLLDEATLERLKSTVALDETLKSVYEYRNRLQAIWNIANASHERLINAFHEWCVEAENSGIAQLQEFAASLRGYRLAKQHACLGAQ